MSQRTFEKETPQLLAEREQRLFAALERALERTRMNREAIRELQFHELKKLLEHAFENIPFYREKYSAVGFHPEQVRSLEDLARIPVLTKEELRREDTKRLVWKSPIDDVRILSSSGSTGVPLNLAKNDEALWYFTARNMILYHAWCDGKPMDRVLYFLDLSTGAIDCALADVLRTTVMEERLVSLAEPPETMSRKLFDYEPEFISSYPSTMRNLATDLLRRRTPYASLRLLHLTSEMLDGGTRALLRRAFPNARVVETYTSTEAGLMGFPCSCGDRLHLAEDAAIYEIVDANNQTTNETGELVVTDLTNNAMPLIRYKGLGDYCRWHADECTCGSPFRAIHNLEGRFVESIQRADGSLLSPYAISNAMEEIAGVCQFQIIQRAIAEFKVLIVKDPQAIVSDDAIRAAVQEAIEKSVGGAPRCETIFVDAIPLGKGRHKIPLVVCEIQRATCA